MTSVFQQQRSPPFDSALRRSAPAPQHGARYTDRAPPAPKPAAPSGSAPNA